MRRPTWLRTTRELAQHNLELIEILEQERAQHLQHLLDVLDLTGTPALHIGNVPRVWPEALEAWRDLARDKGARLLIVSGADQVHGVYSVSPP